MKVMAINSSPRTGSGQSKTELMLDSLVEGMRAAGAQVEVVNLHEKKVRFCQGCFTCWTKTPGQCVLKDDMSQELFPLWLDSDLAVYATPLYHFTVNAHLKAFIERTLPAVEPFFRRSEQGETYHPLRHQLPGAVMLSVAGFPEMQVFDQLSQWARFIFREGLLAEIYRPGAELLDGPLGREVKDKVLAATCQAGRELVETGRVSPETLAALGQPTGDSQQAGLVANMFWRTCINEGVTPREFSKQGLMPRPESIEEFLLLMPLGFKPEAAGELEATIQFDFTGQAEGSCHLSIAGGKATAAQGPAPAPDLTIEVPFELWLDISAGKADAQEAFMQGQAKAGGDLGLLLRLGELFGG